MIRVFWHAFVFGLAPLLQKLVGLILVPLYSHYLAPRDYGEIELLTMLTGVFGLALRLELRPGYIRAWIAAPDERARAALLAGAAALMGGLGLAGAAAFMASYGPLCQALLGYRIGWGYAAVLAVGIAVDVGALVFHATLQARLQSALMVALGVAQFTVNALVTILCVTRLGTGPLGVFLGGTAASLLALAAMAVACLRPHGWTRPDWGGVAGVVRYSLPLLAAAALFFVVRNTDRYAVSRFLSVADLGLYAMAWTLANLIMTMVYGPLQTSLDVWRYRYFDEADGAGKFAEVFRVAMAVIGVASIGIATAGADLFGLLIAPAFAPAMHYVPLLAAAGMLQAAYSIVAAAFFVTGATLGWTMVFAAGAAVQIVASLLLVPRFGIPGAACAIGLANLLLYVGAAVRGRRLWPVPYRHAPLLAAVAAVPALGVVRQMLPPAGPVAALAADAGLVAVYLFVLLAVRLLRRSDAAALRLLFGARWAGLKRRFA